MSNWGGSTLGILWKVLELRRSKTVTRCVHACRHLLFCVFVNKRQGKRAADSPRAFLSLFSAISREQNKLFCSSFPFSFQDGVKREWFQVEICRLHPWGSRVSLNRFNALLSSKPFFEAHFKTPWNKTMLQGFACPRTILNYFWLVFDKPSSSFKRRKNLSHS